MKITIFRGELSGMNFININPLHFTKCNIIIPIIRGILNLIQKEKWADKQNTNGNSLLKLLIKTIQKIIIHSSNPLTTAPLNLKPTYLRIYILVFPADFLDLFFETSKLFSSSKNSLSRAIAPASSFNMLLTFSHQDFKKSDHSAIKSQGDSSTMWKGCRTLFDITFIGT